MAPTNALHEPSLADKSLPVRIRSAALLTLLFLAVLYTAYFAAALLIPITAAVLLQFLLSPIVARLTAWHVPQGIAAVAVVGALILVTIGTVYSLAEPAANWLREAPATIEDIREKFRSGSNPLEDVRDATEAVEEAVNEITGGGTDEESDPSVELRGPRLLDIALNRLPRLAASLLVTLVITLFLLMSGNSLLRKLTAMGRDFSARRRTVVIVRQIEEEISYYLRTVASINACLAVVVAGAMYALGLPNPILWGVIAGTLNFAPYLGPALTMLVIFLASVSAFDTLEEMFLPPLVFLVLTSLEGQLLTPLVLGRRLALSSVAVLLSVLVLGWIWGLAGALMAVPIIASVRIFLVNIPELRTAGTLLAK